MLNFKIESTAVVTGGTSGIGLATADLLLSLGAKVAICGRDKERLFKANDLLSKKYPSEKIFAQTCDVLNKEEVNLFAKNVQEKLGSAEILINNAGQGRWSTFASTTDEEWTQELNLKFFSLINPTRAFLPQLESQKNASIVCVNSLLADQPEPNMVATSAARSGVKNLVKSLANELAPKNIRVNGILIGVIMSNQWEKRFVNRENKNQTKEEYLKQLAIDRKIPLGRIGQPEEAANSIVFLASKLSSYTTGHHIDVSGGQARHA